MTRTEAKKIEARLKARNVYKPFVSMTDNVVTVESYPLTVYVRTGEVDPDQGPVTILRMTDCTLARMGRDTRVTERRVLFGQDPEQHIARLILDYHGPAHARATRQETGGEINRSVAVNQWSVLVGGHWRSLFAPPCDWGTLIALAAATFGPDFEHIKNAGEHLQHLTDQQVERFGIA